MLISRTKLIRFTFALALLIVAYLPTIAWMYERWTEKETYYSHGILIPLVVVFLIWQRREAIAKAVPGSSFAGLLLIVCSLLVHLICAGLRVYFVSGISMVAAIYGLVLFCLGKDVSAQTFFPVWFLLSMVPAPLVVIGNLIVKLKLYVAQAATFVLNHIGFPSVLDGSIIRMPGSYIEVAAPCSGLRSLISLLTLGLLFSYMMKVPYWKKAILLASSVPIALVSNVFRVVVVAMVNDLYGEKVAMGFFHDAMGFVTFAVAFGLLYGVSRWVESSV